MFHFSHPLKALALGACLMDIYGPVRYTVRILLHFSSFPLYKKHFPRLSREFSDTYSLAFPSQLPVDVEIESKGSESSEGRTKCHWKSMKNTISHFVTNLSRVILLFSVSCPIAWAYWTLQSGQWILFLPTGGWTFRRNSNYRSTARQIASTPDKFMRMDNDFFWSDARIWGFRVRSS